LGLLAGSIAHEFNNILTPVLSYAQLALASPEDPTIGTKALKKAVEGTEKASQIAASILGFIRNDPEPVYASIRTVVDDALRCIGRDLSKEGIALEIDVSRSLVASIRPIALEQVVINLVLNAVEAIKPSAGKLRIAARVDPATQHVIIDIDDTGRGIPTHMIDRIFEPFVSARSGDSAKGTGLGLTICKRIVEEAGGSLAVLSRLGDGTTFTMRLPAA
jgi:signal transduction histidine kinase